MFDQAKYSEVKRIISKISRNEQIELKERLLIENLASNDPGILNKLNKAQCTRRLEKNDRKDLTNFLGSLALNGTFQDEHFNPSIETIEEWFLNAPKWLRRS